MKLHYWKAAGGNFGDDLNPWLWPQLLPNFFDEDETTFFVGIGSILSEEAMPRRGRKVVFGSGAWFGKPLPRIDDSVTVYCVRGPLSAQVLRLPAHAAVTDGAVLVRTLVQPAHGSKYAVSYMPHHWSATHGDWRSICDRAGCRFISPSGAVQDIIEEIRGTKLLITEALHGAIVADALRVPWIPVKAYSHILDFKWTDWARSLGLEYKPYRLPALWAAAPTANMPARVRSGLKEGLVSLRLWQIRDTATPLLSADSTIARVTAQMTERLDKLRCDWNGSRAW